MSLWLEKVWQLNQIQKLHHELMLVGPSGSGKNVALQVLIESLEAVTRIKYETYGIDPKAITNDELYGVLGSIAIEWVDGVFTSVLRTIRTTCGTVTSNALVTNRPDSGSLHASTTESDPRKSCDRETRGCTTNSQAQLLRTT